MKSRIQDLDWEKSFVDTLPGDLEKENFVRQVKNACYSFARPQKFPSPSVVIISTSVCKLLGIPAELLSADEFLQAMTGQLQIRNIMPWACCYGGHQFGSWANQLGDGRAITIGELRGPEGRLFDVQLKGSGKTPYSRFADGKAVLRSCIREYLCSEAMHYLHVPTTRALGVFKTGEKVIRDILYDGNPAPEDGAIVCRVSESLVRFGTFEIFATQNQPKIIQQILDFTIQRNFKELSDLPEPDKYFKWLEAVVIATARLFAKWQGVGFVHGVLNTDNMSVLGETIDYGPYGFMEEFEPAWTPNTTDEHYRRYTYENQPDIGFWNVTKLGTALSPFLKNPERIREIVWKYKKCYEDSYTAMYRSKLGLDKTPEDALRNLVKMLKPLLVVSKMDMTMFYRSFAGFDVFGFRSGLTDEFFKHMRHCTYNAAFFESHLENWNAFLVEYQKALLSENSSFEQRQQIMLAANPKYILRNWQLQECINQASQGNYEMLNEMNEMIKRPYDEQPEFTKYYKLRPDWAKKLPGYSMLSCSS